jgi:pimeloyl-ACP methyl ester carboxylesterase
MREEPFDVAAGGAVLRGHSGGSGAAALLLHGGAAVPDYLGDCAALLDGLFSTIRYTQRGTPPSGEADPYTIESHASDAVAVLDAFGLALAWVIGHSWGGHLAMHLALLHPDRVAGLLLIDPLGADPSVFAEQDANLRRGLTPEQIARVDAVEERRRAGAVTEGELVERIALIWTQFFTRYEAISTPPEHVGVQASIGTNRSIADHYERQTLKRGLPTLRVPALFVHGEQDPLPLRSTLETAELIPGALVETIPDCGHFPWLEQPAAFRAAVERLLSAV